MNIISLAILRPIAVVSGVLMVILFGLVALQTIPIQLAPDVSKPVISIRTSWPGAAPIEVEREITNRQEDVLKGLNNLAGMESSSSRGSARVTLEFNIGTNMDKALLLVSNRLDRVGDYPAETSEPTLSMSGSEDRPIAWFILKRLPGNTRSMHEYGDFLTDVLQERLERVEGVSEVAGFGGSERELQVIVKPQLLARFHITPADMIKALRNANAAVTAGKVDEGKRSYTVRSDAELNSIESVESVIIRSESEAGSSRIGRVSVADIAEVKFAYKTPTSNIRQLGEPSIAFNAKRETGANVIKTMEGIRTAVKELSEGPVNRAGLRIIQAYDETVYIESAIDLVRQNIWTGGSLAAFLLLLFLRSWRATLIVSIAIPVSVIGSFVAMAALGRSLNVISLAGLAFAVGMVVDAAIVVLENIYRLREQGKSRREAAYEGARQVWGAVFVSALTTVMVFLPLLVMKLEVGQLFRDIAVAISVSVLLSLLVSVTVLPSLASKLLPSDKKGTPRRFGIVGLDQLAGGFVDLVVGYARLILKSKLVALMVVIGISVATTFAAWQFLPKLEYLPNGNRNLMFGILAPPPGYNLKTMTDIAARFEDATRPFWVSGNEAIKQPEKPGDVPKMRHFFFVALADRTFIGAAAEDPSKASLLQQPLQKLISKEPGTFGIISQLSLFGRGLGGARQIELDIAGPSLNSILETAGKAAGEVFRVFPRNEGNGFRPVPGLELGAPEIRINPNRIALADAGITATELGQSVDVFNDGLRVAEITVDGKRIDLRLKGPQDDITQTQGIAILPVLTRNGEIVPVSSLAKVELTNGPTQIRHKERRRAITLKITPRSDIPLETALATMQREVIGKLEAQGLPTGVTIRMSGTAEKLDETWSAMQGQLVIAIILVYLVMAVLFESFIYPLIILLSVPLAAAGGVGGLSILNLYYPQKLDMLTMLGFVILIGIVVNNAILLVHQTLVHIRQDGMSAPDAIVEATRNRIRPIFMSTLTSVFGMLPLVMLPGAGSELYRGLGSVVVGGLSVSALLTLLVIPPMLAIVVGPLEARRQKQAE